MKLPKYDFKKNWYKLLIFFIFDTLVIMFCSGLLYCLDNPELLPTELLKLGKYEITYYDMTLIFTFSLMINLLIGLVKSLWSILFDWSIKGFRKDDDDANNFIR